MQHESEYNLTCRIYFSGLLEILVQRRTVRVHCAAGNMFQPTGGGNAGGNLASLCVWKGARGKCAHW